MQTQEKVKNLLEIADGLIKIGGLITIAYVIITGLAHRSGSKLGEKIFLRRRERDKKPIFKALLREERQPPFWKDDRLIHGGLRGITALAILSSYVVLMLIAVRPPAAELHGAVAILLCFPNAGAAFFILMLVIGLKRDAGVGSWVITGVSVLAAIASWLLISQAGSMGDWFKLALQGSIFFLQSLALSFTVGVFWGMRESDLEQRLPLVEVTTRAGVINGVRMRGSSKGEYRFITADGSELLIPSAQIRLIRTADSAADKEAPKP